MQYMVDYTQAIEYMQADLAEVLYAMKNYDFYHITRAQPAPLDVWDNDNEIVFFGYMHKEHGLLPLAQEYHELIELFAEGVERRLQGIA